MKWFKHDCDALTDIRIRRLIRKHSITGYGVYFAMLELISKNVTAGNRTFNLQEEIEELAEDWKITLEILNQIIEDMKKLELIQEANGTVSIPKIAYRLDNYMTKVNAREIKTKDERIEKLLLYHRERVEEKCGKLTANPDMDAWYLALEDMIKEGIPMEMIQESIDFAISSDFWYDKITHGGRLKKNINTIIMQMKKIKQEDKYNDL